LTCDRFNQIFQSSRPFFLFLIGKLQPFASSSDFCGKKFVPFSIGFDFWILGLVTVSSDFGNSHLYMLRAIGLEPEGFYLYIGITLSGYIVAQGFRFCNMEYCTK